MFTAQTFSDGLARNDFVVDTTGTFHLRTWQDLAVFAANAAFVVAVALMFAVAITGLN